MNPHRISVARTLEEEGLTLQQFLDSSFSDDGVSPACCDEGCLVEPDGYCEHGCPSLHLALGVI